MPISYTILKTHNLIYLRFDGPATLADFDRLRPLVLSDPDFKPTLSQLVDTRAGSLSGLSSVEIRTLASTTIFSAGVRRATVAVTDLDYGLARMFEVFAQCHNHNVQVFRSMEEACEWLGVPVEELPGDKSFVCFSNM